MSWRLSRERTLSISINIAIISFRSSGTFIQSTWTKTQTRFKPLKMKSKDKLQMNNTTTWEDSSIKLGGLTDLWTCKWFHPFCISSALTTATKTSVARSTQTSTTIKSTDAPWFTRTSRDMMIMIGLWTLTGASLATTTISNKKTQWSNLD